MGKRNEVDHETKERKKISELIQDWTKHGEGMAMQSNPDGYTLQYVHLREGMKSSLHCVTRNMRNLDNNKRNHSHLCFGWSDESQGGPMGISNALSSEQVFLSGMATLQGASSRKDQVVKNLKKQ